MHFCFSFILLITSTGFAYIRRNHLCIKILIVIAGTRTYMHTKNNLQRGLELDQGIGFRHQGM